MKKGIIIAVFAVVLIGGLFSLGSAGSKEKQTDSYASVTDEQIPLGDAAVAAKESSPTPTEKPWGTFKDFSVEVVGHEVTGKSNGDKCLVVQYSFTNNANTAEAFGWNVTDKAYQDGVELKDGNLYLYEDDIEYDNRMADIRSGVTVNVKRSYVIRSDSDVEIEISKYLSQGKGDVYTTTLAVA